MSTVLYTHSGNSEASYSLAAYHGHFITMNKKNPYRIRILKKELFRRPSAYFNIPLYFVIFLNTGFFLQGHI